VCTCLTHASSDALTCRKPTELRFHEYMSFDDV
jgi:hypothetical protein